MKKGVDKSKGKWYTNQVACGEGLKKLKKKKLLG